MSNEIPGDYRFPCYYCGGIRFVDPRRKGRHIRCAIMAWFRLK